MESIFWKSILKSDAHVTEAPYPTWIALALVVKPIVAMPRLRKSRQIERIFQSCGAWEGSVASLTSDLRNLTFHLISFTSEMI